MDHHESLIALNIPIYKLPIHAIDFSDDLDNIYYDSISELSKGKIDNTSTIEVLALCLDPLDTQNLLLPKELLKKVSSLI